MLSKKAAEELVAALMVPLESRCALLEAENRELVRLLDEARAECNGLGCGKCAACHRALRAASYGLLGAAKMMLGKFQSMHDNDTLRLVYEDPTDTAIEAVSRCLGGQS